MAVGYFSAIPNKDISPPSFDPHPYTPEQLGVRVHVVPVKDSRQVELSWVMPSVQKDYLTKPDRLLW